MKFRMLLVALFVLTFVPLQAGERLAIRVSPNVCFAPANLTVRTTIESDAGNRAIEIIAESGDFYRASQVPLDGDKAPRTTTFEFRSLPSGSYQVKATLLGDDGKPRASVHQAVNVISNGAGR